LYDGGRAREQLPAPKILLAGGSERKEFPKRTDYMAENGQ
jgi:hypothetical protein